MNIVKRKLGLLFHGKKQTPISLACKTCPLLEHSCQGSVYNDGCPTHAVKQFEPYHYAQLILEDNRAQGNHFILARVCDYPLQGENTTQYEDSLCIDNKTIQQIQQDYNTKETLYIEEETPLSDIQETDLPF